MHNYNMDAFRVAVDVWVGLLQLLELGKVRSRHKEVQD